MSANVLSIQDCSSDGNAISRSKDNVDVATEKYKDHSTVKMINGNLSFESRFSFKEIFESCKNEVYNLTPRRQWIKILRKYLRILQIFITLHFKIYRIMILEKQYVPKI